MNPILLKPTTDVGSQVIINGKVSSNMTAREYYKHKKQLIPVVREAYDKLSEDYDIIVIEGAGSPAEVNLRDDDIVNMGMAELADAPVLLVGDIDRGGVFAQLYGTIELLEDYEKARIKGLIINKFRGDVSILESGIKKIEELCALPVLCVLPYEKIYLDDEDSLSERLIRKENEKLIDIAVIRLPRISNFTDLDVFDSYKEVSVRYVSSPYEIGEPDLLVIPGTKSTVSDLLYLRQSGLEAKIKQYAAHGRPLIGICGGYQMLGKTITERGETVRGLGLLPCRTYFSEKRETVRCSFEMDFMGEILKGEGYEIHMGQTVPEGGRSFTRTSEGKVNGCAENNIFGSYIHGLFDDTADRMISFLAKKKGINEEIEKIDFSLFRKEQFDKLEKLVRQNLDMKKIYKIAGLSNDT
jgi:adenosylcobyric acid synthase